jgi:ornithine cyclodeaminase/alanine dehydrogenase-like protein (mu-crystallin family)
MPAMAILLSDEDVRSAADMASMVDAVEVALKEEAAGQVDLPPRMNLMRDGGFLRIMPAQMDGSGLVGFKAFHGSMAKGVRYLIVLCSAADGEILALVDAAYLTAARTGATSGVATRYMARPGPATVGVIGSGLEADTNLSAVAVVRDLKSVKVYSRSEDRRSAFAAKMAERFGVSVVPVATPQEAVAGTDIVVVATNTGMNGPVAYEAPWIEPGQHIVSIGSTSPFLRELDTEVFTSVDRIVIDAAADQIIEECGDALAGGDDVKAALHQARLLADVVDKGVVNAGDDGTTLFKSVGTAAQDLIAAKSVLDIALARGLGRDIGTVAAPKTF